MKSLDPHGSPGLQVSVRRVRLPEDLASLLALDTTFRTGQVLGVQVEETRITFQLETLPAPREKRFPLGKAPADPFGVDGPWNEALVAVVVPGADPATHTSRVPPGASLEPPAASLEPPGASLEPPLASPEPPLASEASGRERVVGFIALKWERWNRRGTIWHLYVDAASRGAGVGRRLVDEAHTLAREAGLRGLWLEVTNHNLPAIRFYQRVGFELCGVDTSLYDPEGDASGECALFFFRPIDPD